MPDLEFVVDEIFPTHELSLISGPSGVGKSILTAQHMVDWAAGRPVMGQPSHPLPYCYIGCDHSIETMQRRLGQLGINPASVPHASLLLGPPNHSERTIETAVNQALKLDSQVKVLWLDGFASLCEGQINNARDATRFMLNALRVCKERRITIIGTAYASKAKEGEEYASPLARIAGSVVIGSLAWTKIVMEFTRPRTPADPFRTIHLYRPNAPHRVYQYEFDTDGHLLYRNEGEVHTDLDGWLAQLPAGTQLASGDVVAIAATFGISRSTAHRWRANQESLGLLVRVARGVYQVPDATLIQ